MRILLVEDEPRMSHLIARGLRERSYAVDPVADGEAALYQAAINDYDLIVLDLMLPRKPGLEVCRELREGGLAIPILMLTARDAIDDRVAGLDAGADDYLVKPFDFKELLARIRALLRRRGVVRPARLQIADLVLDTATHRVERAGRQIHLTAREYALLEYFILRADCLLGREEISEHVWDDNYDPTSNIIDVYVRRLRRKVDEGFDSTLIQTRRGEGYMLTDGAGKEQEGARGGKGKGAEWLHD